MKRTEISTLGEFGLIRHLTHDITPQNASTLYGVGDDCAVMHYPDKEVLVSTDMLMEGIHFDLVYTPLKHLGYKAAVVNFSDLYAMNATPRQLLVSLALSKLSALRTPKPFMPVCSWPASNMASTSLVATPPPRSPAWP